MKRRDEILAKLKDVPAMPRAAAEACRLLQDPDVSPATVAEVIQYDPGLAGNVLKVANSAYFGGPRQIDNIVQAISRLGTSRIHQLVIAAVAAPVAKRPVEGYDLPAGDLWGHSVAVAVGAEQAAEALGLQAPGHTFTAALLHDIGKIVLGTFVEVDVGPLLKAMESDGLTFEEAEEHVLGFNHAELGHELLTNWGLPDTVTEVVRWHHHPEQYTGDPLVVDLVHTADVLSMTCGIGIGIDGLQYKSSVESTARLALGPEKTEEIVCRTLSALEDIKGLFGD